jgi:hypothetical protein
MFPLLPREVNPPRAKRMPDVCAGPQAAHRLLERRDEGDVPPQHRGLVDVPTAIGPTLQTG